MPAARRYSTPCSSTRLTTTSAIAPVAAEIIAGRPPAIAIVTAIVNDAYRPTLGSTPAISENEIASGINASATTRPANSSTRRTLPVGNWKRRGGSATAEEFMYVDSWERGDDRDAGTRRAPAILYTYVRVGLLGSEVREDALAEQRLEGVEVQVGRDQRVVRDVRTRPR